MFNITSFSPVLKNRNFLKLWGSQLLSQPTGHILNFILVIKIYELTQSNALVSLLVALVSVPPILFSTTAGVLADSFNRKYILFFSNLLRSLIVLGFIFLGTMPLAILILAFLASVIAQFFSPAESSSIPDLVKKEEYFTANSFFLFTIYSSFLLGYSLAGPILHYLGGTKTYIILMAGFLLASISNLLLPPLNKHLIHPLSEGAALLKSFGKVWQKFKEGILFIKGDHLVLLVILQIALVFSVERSVIALVPDFADKLLNFDVRQISYYLITPVGVGALVGAILANRLKYRFSKLRLIMTGLVLAGTGLILMPFFRSAPLIVQKLNLGFLADGWPVIIYMALMAFLSGLADVFIIVSAQTILQERTPSASRGRVFGNLTTIMNAVGVPLILVVGFLASVYSVQKVIFSLGLLILLATIISFILIKRLKKAA